MSLITNTIANYYILYEDYIKIFLEKLFPAFSIIIINDKVLLQNKFYDYVCSRGTLSSACTRL